VKNQALGFEVPWRDGTGLVPTILAASFTASLARLNGQEQKQAKLTAFDLQTEPDRPGLQFHRIDKSKDPNFWSLRVSRDIRVIVHKTGASLLLAYVGHHDDAYAWAERRRIETHPTTGAVQIVEVRERVEAIAAPAPGQSDLGFGAEEIAILPLSGREKGQQPAGNMSLFATLDRDALLSVGVPDDWIADVAKADDDTFLELADHLPAEAAEALLDYVSTGILKVPEPLPAAADPFAHPDTLRRFRVVENRDELAAALEFPWEKWAVFLHPAQRAIVERDFAGPARVMGSAGTGKTVVALHRAVRLARADGDAKVLLTTFSEPLAAALRRNLKALADSDRGILDRTVVTSFLGIAEELYMLAFGRKAHLASRELARSLVGKAVEGSERVGFSGQFVLSEWFNVVDAWQVSDIETYAVIPRMGRRARLGVRQREGIWPILDRVREGIAERGLMTPASLFAAVTRHYVEKDCKPFTHIVVDEAQDLGVPELRFLSSIAPDHANAIFFAGDIGQRIFQQPISWKNLGVDVRGRSFSLKVNYRTSHQIRIAADRLLPKTVREADGLEDEREGVVSVFNGPPPHVLVADNEADEASAVAAFIRSALADGVDATEIGIFVRSREELPRARKAAAMAGAGVTELSGGTEGKAGRIAIGTMHVAKGLEFKAVAVMACDETVIPSASRLAEVSDEMELDEVYATERQLLYVAATRARDRLLVSAVSPGSEFLSDFSNRAG
jgi:hypothetical protein